MRPVKTVVLRGKRWRVASQKGLRPPDVAECDDGKSLVKIPVDGDTLHELDWIVHEALHACVPDLSEEAVDETATGVARFLWRLGWRLSDGDEEDVSQGGNVQ